MNKKFLTLGLALSATVLLAACGGNNDDQKIKELESTIESLKKENAALKGETTSSTSGKQTESSSKDTSTNSGKFKLNETLELGNGNKKVAEIKITNATTNQAAFPEHMIGLDDYDTTKMIAIEIEYTNVDFPENFLPSSYDFQAYSDNGKSLERVSQQDGQDEVSKGRTGKTKIFFKTETDGTQINHIELDYTPSGSSEKIATFDLTVSH